MLSNEEIQKNKLRYLEILSTLNIDLSALSDFLNDVNYYYAPLTIKSDKSYPGGLCEYNLSLYDQMIKLRDFYNLNFIYDEDIIKVALFKNFYKCAMFECSTKNQKNPTTGQWEEVPCYQVSENRPVYGNSGISSMMLAKHFIEFTDAQSLAIMYSGLNETNVPDIFEMFRTRPLLVLTHLADISASFIGESNNE